MVEEDRVIVIDLDGTLCPEKEDGDEYMNLLPDAAVIEKLREYKEKGFYIIIYSARNMRTYHGNIGKINANTLKAMLIWLDKYQVPYDEIYVGKPWAGKRGFYVDDKTIRPSEFLSMTYEEIMEIIGRRKE